MADKKNIEVLSTIPLSEAQMERIRNVVDSGLADEVIIEEYERALQLAGSGAVRLGTTSYTAGNLRDRLETGYRRLAQLSADPAERAQLVDRANAVRVWSLL